MDTLSAALKRTTEDSGRLEVLRAELRSVNGGSEVGVWLAERVSMSAAIHMQIVNLEWQY